MSWTQQGRVEAAKEDPLNPVYGEGEYPLGGGGKSYSFRLFGAAVAEEEEHHL